MQYTYVSQRSPNCCEVRTSLVHFVDYSTVGAWTHCSTRLWILVRACRWQRSDRGFRVYRTFSSRNMVAFDYHEQFASCVLAPVNGGAEAVTSSNGKKWKTSSFYLDSSGRASIALPLQLQFPSKKVLDSFVSLGCVCPAPKDGSKEESTTEIETGASVDLTGESATSTTTNKTNEPGVTAARNSLISIEAKVTLTFGTGQAIAARAEGVTILSTKIDAESNSLHFNTEIIVRVSRAEGGKVDSGESSGVKTNVEINAAFTERLPSLPSPTQSALGVLDTLSRGHPATRHIATTRLVTPLELHVALTHALSIAVRSVPGPAMGQNFLALTMTHSNTHQQPVKITSIALHPGVTRQEGKDPTDMSHSVMWGYAPYSDPKLPLTLLPNEAYSVIMTVDAREDSQSRRCYCPLSISATVGKQDSYHIVAATDAYWTTSRAAIEPADSFLIDLSLGDGADESNEQCVVGSPLTVNVEITNLSSEPRQLMLVLDSASESSTRKSTGPSNRWGLVTEVEGYKFGVGGPDDRDQELFVIDAALLLGELKGQSSTRARLRAIPLREGSLNIPNFKLVDNRTGRRYSCIHKLQVVVQAPK